MEKNDSSSTKKKKKKEHKQTCDFVGIKYSKLRNYLKSTNLDNIFSLQKTLNASCTSLKGKGTAYNHAVTVLHEARRWVDWFINDCIHKVAY